MTSFSLYALGFVAPVWMGEGGFQLQSHFRFYVVCCTDVYLLLLNKVRVFELPLCPCRPFKRMYA